MYSGSTLTRASGRILGAHQKIDRVARTLLFKLIPKTTDFPSIRRILYFEGHNGPDAIKRKSPAQDEPWHYFDPFNENDTELTELIKDHYDNLVSHLKNNNMERSAFEAAWLAHAIVDGLTPAHHFPYEEKLKELRGGQGRETRTTIAKKLFMPGETKRQKLKNNWKMWGAKGLMVTHGSFEMGVAALIAPLRFSDALPAESDIKRASEIGPISYFEQTAKEIATLEMFDKYYKKGWTPKLAWQVRHKLGPLIIQTVTLTWYLALKEAGKIE